MPRIARLCGVGLPHHITQRGNNRVTVFFEDEDRKFYLKILNQYSDQWTFEVLAYCLMPNHVHILAVPRKEESLAKGIGGTNLVYTQYINRKYTRSGRLWQNRFFSTIIDQDAYLWAVARYIERNPVRAHLSESAESYIWSSAKAHILGINDDILSPEGWRGERDLSAYRDFISKAGDDVERTIRKATSTGRPLGSNSFIQQIETILRRDIFPRKAGRPKKEE